MAKPEEAVEFLRQVVDAESDNRQQALQDLKFRYGEQWPQYAVASRGIDRPQLTINEMDSYIRQVTNGQRQQRPRIKVHPCDSLSDPKIAKVITGLIRHIEVNSDADNAYDTAFDWAATIGWGYWRIRTDYVSESSFDQDIYLDVVENPFSVYFDYNSKLPDGSDAEKALVGKWIRKEILLREYPGATMPGFSEHGTGDSDPDWVSEHSVRLAEYFYVDRKKSKLVMLSDGSVFFEDDLPPDSLIKSAGLSIRGDRDSFKRVIKWCKQTASEILEERELPGKWIPIVPVYWTRVEIDSKLLCQGLVRPAMDSQRMVNFWQTSITESIALAPKAKWLVPEGGDEGHEKEYQQANLSPNPVLRYKTTGVDGREIPPPQRIAPEPPPSGSIEAAFLANQNLQRVMGIFDPAVRSKEPKSGKAINAERSQSENSNFHGYDNLTRSIKHTGRIILSYIPKIYDTQRVQRIIGEDGTPDLVTLNQRSQGQDETGMAIEKVLNDVRVGEYDVVMDTGPGYDTKRIESVESLMALLGTPLGEKVANVADDVIVRQMDFNGSDVVSDRLAAANPLSQIDDKSEIPPRVQMQIKAMQDQLQKAGQMIQALQGELKTKAGLEQMKQEAETRRELIRSTAKTHENELWAQEERDQFESVERTRIHDTQTRALSAQHVEELRGIVQLLLKKIDVSQFEKEADEEHRELQ